MVRFSSIMFHDSWMDKKPHPESDLLQTAKVLIAELALRLVCEQNFEPLQACKKTSTERVHVQQCIQFTMRDSLHKVNEYSYPKKARA
jgi:hypothetical protein